MGLIVIFSFNQPMTVDGSKTNRATQIESPKNTTFPFRPVDKFLPIEVPHKNATSGNTVYYYRPTMIDFLMPENRHDKGENPIVDSLGVSSKWTIVSKCTLHGLIYVWDLQATLREAEEQQLQRRKELADGEGQEVIEQDVVLLANLRWADTDNFMNLGCQKGEETGVST